MTWYFKLSVTEIVKALVKRHFEVKLHKHSPKYIAKYHIEGTTQC